MDQMGQRRFRPRRPEAGIIESGRNHVELVGIDDTPMQIHSTYGKKHKANKNGANKQQGEQIRRT